MDRGKFPDYSRSSEADVKRWLSRVEIIGLTEEQLMTAAQTAGIVVRVISRGDGRSLGITADRRGNRVNVEMVDGRVSRVNGLY